MRHAIRVFFTTYFRELVMGTAWILGVFLGSLALSPFVYLYGRFIMGWW